MKTRPSPTVRRRRLGIELRRLREEAGLKIEQVARALECAPSTVSRMETGQVFVRPRDLRAMLELYRVNDGRQDRLLELARQAQLRGWWHGHGDVAGTFVRLEAAAASIRSYEALVVPGLLQTEQYAREVLRKVRPDLAADAIEERVSFRMLRQSQLRDDPPELWAILDEAVVCRPIGGQEVMREQLNRLVLAAEQPTVRLQILPFSAGGHSGLGGPFAIIDFAQPDDSQLVYLEQSESILYIEDITHIELYTRRFKHLLDSAMDLTESKAFLASLTR
jgi:transcriptional regulator with XRE-family HTH domain